MSEKQKMPTWKKITIITLSVILGLVALFCGFVGYFHIPVSDYYSASQQAFAIPETGSGYIAQGLTYDNSKEIFILSGYMKDKSPSPLYAVSRDGEYLKKITLKTPEGEDYTGHGGGVATFNKFIYLASGDTCLYVYSLNDFVSAEDGASLDCLGTIPLNKGEDDYVKASFVTVYGSRLIAGEFYREGNYPTPDSHKFTTKNGDYNQALAVEFLLSSGYKLGVSPTPDKAYSLPDQVQGVAVNGDKIYLSTSWGLSFSHILEYSKNNLTRQDDITILNTTLPLYALDSDSLLNDYKIAPMSEEIAFVDNYLYVNCESASNKYIFGKFTGGKYLYRTDLSKMVEQPEQTEE